MQTTLPQRLFYFTPVLFCFCLPFGSLAVSALVSFWTITSFLNLKKDAFIAGLKNKWFWLMFVFLIITVLSAFFSENKTEAATAIEVKLSCVVFPYLLFCFKWPIEILKRMVMAFVSGCAFTCVVLLVRATGYALSGEPNYFYYTLFSYFIHPSYFAMYLIMAITLIVMYYPQWFQTIKSFQITSYFFIALFVTCVFLCASKMGLIGFFVSFPILLVYRYKNSLSVKRTLITALLILMLGILSLFLFPSSMERLQSLTTLSEVKIDKTTIESTQVRVLIWKECLNIIETNWLFGTGIGDANDVLYRAYQKGGLTGAYEHHFNAHNQFLQSFIGLGSFGFLNLLGLTFGLLVSAISKRNLTLCLFGLLLILNFMVESMLQTSAGILFFCFFYSLLNLPELHLQKK